MEEKVMDKKHKDKLRIKNRINQLNHCDIFIKG